MAPIALQSQRGSDSLPAEVKDDTKRPAPLAGGCRIEGFVRVKKVTSHTSNYSMVNTVLYF